MYLYKYNTISINLHLIIDINILKYFDLDFQIKNLMISNFVTPFLLNILCPWQAPTLPGPQPGPDIHTRIILYYIPHYIHYTLDIKMSLYLTTLS